MLDAAWPMLEVLEKICDQLVLSRKRQCTWSATEQAGEDAGGCGVLERAEGGGRGHSGTGSAPAAADDEDWRAGSGRALDSGC